MRRLFVKPSGGGSYAIQIGRGLLGRIASSLEAKPLGHRYAIITDRTVRDLYGETLVGRLERRGISCRLFSFPPGESRKTLETFRRLLENLLGAGFGRTDAVIALGGGVVGDTAGYVAAAYMRGIPYLQVPTTLLAMVDSSIGGKVAVDLPGGKNTVGHFWQPRGVFVDPSCLETLPLRERRCGWVEMVKHGIIADRSHFDWLERNAGRLLRLRGKSVEEILAGSLRIKARVVAKDERETGLRMILNYGHTIGHAIESTTRYRKYTHGEAVAIGMNVEGRIARILGCWKEEDLLRQNRLLRRLGLKISFPPLPARKLLAALRHDKKVARGVVAFVLPRRIGAMQTEGGRFGLSVDPKVVTQAIREATR